MGNNQTNSEYPNPETNVYEAARDGAVVVLSDVLQRMSNQRPFGLSRVSQKGIKIYFTK